MAKDHHNIESTQAVHLDLPSNINNIGLADDKTVPTVRPVTCPKDALLLVHYPWKRAPKIKLDRMQPIEIDIWCNTVQDYHEFKIPKEITPVISEVKGYGLRARPIKSEPITEDPKSDKTDQLIDQVQALIDTAKTFATKPVNRKHSRKRSTENTLKPDAKLKALDVLHEMTVNNLSTLHVGTDGTNVPSDSVPHTPKKRKIKCKMCSEIFGSMRELNVHHKKDHGIVKCPKCDKYFSTQSSLDKHSYSHGELKFNCEICGRCFAFQSRLDQHMTVHITHKIPCPKKKCDREFKSIWDLNRRMNSHSKGGWYYCDYCDYKNKDKRNTDSHMRRHSSEEDSRYECDKCGKRMRYSTQYKCHQEQGCD